MGDKEVVVASVFPLDGVLGPTQALRRIRKLVCEGFVTWPEYAKARMAQRELSTPDIEFLIRSGCITEPASRPGKHWRYTVVGRLVTGHRAKCVVELKGSIVVIVTAYRVK